MVICVSPYSLPLVWSLGGKAPLLIESPEIVIAIISGDNEIFIVMLLVYKVACPKLRSAYPPVSE